MTQTISLAKIDAKRISPPRQHQWSRDVQYLAAAEFPDGHARSVRACLVCGAIKGTVHGDGWAMREWRTKDGKVWNGFGDPKCEGGGAE